MKTTNLRKTIATTLAGLALLGTPLLHAVDVSEYGALKGKRYTQNAAGTPSDEFVFYGLLGYVRMTADAAVTEATVQPPGSMAWPMEANATNPRLLQFDMAFATTPADLNMLFPNGDYVVAMTTVHDGNKSVALSLTGDSYPNTPRFLNFAALETVDSSAAFALSWSAFTGGGANDVIEVRVVNNDDIQVFGTTLTGTATSVNIPANTLSPESSYTVTLTFVKVTDRDTTSYAGATGLAGYYKATEASLTTTTGGGGTDTTPPHLVASYPANGATGVATGFPLAFSFDEAMAAAQSIAWSANVNAANINYSWSDDTTLTCNYTGGWPAGATISWTLNPTGQPQNFKDVAGNPLAANTYTGSFTTAGNTNTNGPCGGENDGRGYGGVTKELFYVQTIP